VDLATRSIPTQRLRSGPVPRPGPSAGRRPPSPGVARRPGCRPRIVQPAAAL